MKVILNNDKEIVKSIKEKIKENKGYCPCALTKSADTRCMCKNFRDKIKNGYIGECDCGLYQSIPTIVYLIGDSAIKQDFINWNLYFSARGMLVLMPGTLFHKEADGFTEEELSNFRNIHEQKIIVSDLIFIIDKYGRVDDGIEKVVAEAKKLGKKIQYASEMEN